MTNKVTAAFVAFMSGLMPTGIDPNQPSGPETTQGQAQLQEEEKTLVVDICNHCLRFASEAVAIAEMPQFRSEDGWILASHDHALDPIGIVHKPTGRRIATIASDGQGQTPPIFLEAGRAVPEGFQAVDEMTPSAGWHCNLHIAKFPPNLVTHEIFPAFPKRVWA